MICIFNTLCCLVFFPNCNVCSNKFEWQKKKVNVQYFFEFKERIIIKYIHVIMLKFKHRVMFLLISCACLLIIKFGNDRLRGTHTAREVSLSGDHVDEAFLVNDLQVRDHGNKHAYSGQFIFNCFQPKFNLNDKSVWS